MLVLKQCHPPRLYHCDATTFRSLFVIGSTTLNDLISDASLSMLITLIFVTVVIAWGDIDQVQLNF